MEHHSDVILITGSSGLIGSALAERLSKHYRVAGFDRPGAPHPPPIVEAIGMDLTSKENMDYAFERFRNGYGKRIASVVHLAAYYDFAGKPSPLYDKVTVKGTEHLLEHLQNFEVEQFIFSSTMLVHAPCEPGQKINEHSRLDPKWDYPKSKLKTEKLLLKKHGSIPVVLQRIAGVYTDAGHSIPLVNQIQRIYERQITSKLFPGDIQRGQSFIHLDDLIEMTERIIERRKSLPKEWTVLAGEEETLSYDELQRTFGKLIHNEVWETQQIPKAVAKTGAWLQDLVPGEEPFIKPWMIDLADDHFELDMSEAEKQLDWKPRRSLRKTLPKMVAALKKNPVAWYKEHELEIPASLAV